MIAVIIAVVVVLALVVFSLRVVKEYERGVAFRLGRCANRSGRESAWLSPGWTSSFASIYAW